jgi:hypothetical protein
MAYLQNEDDSGKRVVIILKNRQTRNEARCEAKVKYPRITKPGAWPSTLFCPIYCTLDTQIRAIRLLEKNDPLDLKAIKIFKNR